MPSCRPACRAAISNSQKFVAASKEYSDLGPLVEAIGEWRKAETELKDAEAHGGRSGHEGHGRGRGRGAEEAPAGPGADREAHAAAQGRGRREERHPGDPRRHRRRRGGAVRRRSFPHVPALRRRAWLALRGHGALRHRHRRLQGGDRHRLGPRRVRPAEVRIGRASRAARAGHRGPGPHPYLGRNRGGAARGRGIRHQDRREGPAHRRLPLVRTGRPVGQHDRIRRCASPTSRPAWW